MFLSLFTTFKYKLKYRFSSFSKKKMTSTITKYFSLVCIGLGTKSNPYGDGDENLT